MKYKNYNDYELIYMVRENDEYSYGILFDKYLPIVKRIAFDYYKNFNGYGYEYDDFLQEGYLGFQKAISSYDDTKDNLFYTFVTLCIKRRILSFCRRMTCNKNNINDSNFIPIEDSNIASSDDTEILFIKKELYHNIWDVVYSFPFEYTCVFELKYNQFQYHEIEKLINVPIRRAEFMMGRIYKRIRQEVNFYV